MKNKILIVIFFLAAFFFSSCDKKADNNAKQDFRRSQRDSVMPDNMTQPTAMAQSMSNMMQKMKACEMTDNADINFATMMIIHHQGAIDMSKVEIAEGIDAEIVSMAKNIVNTQKEEILQMEVLLKNIKTAKELPKISNELSAKMKSLMDNMDKMRMTGYADEDYVMLMIPHHESALLMAEDELANGTQIGLRKMAEKMKIIQNQEILAFKTWQSNKIHK